MKIHYINKYFDIDGDTTRCTLTAVIDFDRFPPIQLVEEGETVKSPEDKDNPKLAKHIAQCRAERNILNAVDNCLQVSLEKAMKLKRHHEGTMLKLRRAMHNITRHIHELTDKESC